MLNILNVQMLPKITAGKSAGLSSGQVLKMLATDPGSVNDVQSWSKRTENALLNHSEDGGVYSFLIKKK